MNFILTRDKAITIAPAALKLSGIPDDAKLELTTLDGAVILTRSKMTAMEYVKPVSYTHLPRIRRAVRFAGTIRPATGTTTMLRSPTRSSVSAPSLKS